MPYPYRWNSVQNKFYISKSYPTWYWVLVCLIYTCAVILQSVYNHISPDKSKLWEDMLRVYIIFVYSFMAGFTCFHRFKSQAVCEYLNSLIQFEKHYVHKSEHKSMRNCDTKLIVFLSVSFDISHRAITMLIPAIAVILPKSPWNVFSSLYVLCSQWIPTAWHMSSLLKITVFLGNHLLGRLVIDSTIMCYTVSFMIGVYSIKCCLHIFQKISMSSLSGTTLKIYRKVQIVISLYNVAHRNTCMVLILLHSIIGSIIFSYLSLGNFRELHPVMLGTCVLIASTLNAQILLAFRIPTQVYTSSRTICRSVERKLLMYTCSNIKWMNRFWKSCQIVRIEFFGNYFDNMTSLVILRFCIDHTINLILLKK